ncbi:hypothetical protein E6P09_08750 [Haloferax mediterranei ATCC 33500]|uniref:Uncharacterized protein n=1 Tax=Haloferax mediterranei (strain ATCC 33500 / DSM 1411 / JCM 8866 / NBRC 14739 / NCIMB 2177 / R-4) TaxID=523841 RepID=I3R3Q2_HALMT|nr:hypothetical protein [Haloferax mediterranei]AFK18862.1 hypothetical protein HFX_1146 [Haloferax mediterranei ATCC 33500]AHZ21774.1 hypothetical protein BM92_03480 [Haloferax mediterranei ATCC 33500]EMA03280.1 hypothetical protein C439_04760 [Haloferax mediterranei ATCC 33500]MDX5988955.1 hypothetical protein [Haloferax mediterranei ATCC 33500]QCQ75349.1 hypothetical protein E6P09_08750 [Haloferax mediterranei ATCC 33500]
MSFLADLRRGRYAELALVVATIIGLVAAFVHWAGLILGGVLVGILATSVRRAVPQGLTFGGVAVALHIGMVWWQGELDALFAMETIFALTVAIGFVLPMLAAVGARALVGDV